MNHPDTLPPEANDEITPEDLPTAAKVPEVESDMEAAVNAAAVLRPLAFPTASNTDIPDWVIIPKGLKIPKHKQVFYIRFRAEMTDTPAKGERQAIVWANNLGDQKLAVMRSDRDPNRMSEQMAIQMIRAVDGHVADWTGELGNGNIEIWWDAIGPKCRSIIDRLFVQLHVATKEDLTDFFENCVAVRLQGG
jgi:hypothetical protein